MRLLPRRRAAVLSLVVASFVAGSASNAGAIEGSRADVAIARIAYESFKARLIGGLAERVAIRTAFREGSSIYFGSGLLEFYFLATWVLAQFDDLYEASIPQGDGSTSERVMTIRARFATYPLAYQALLYTMLYRFLRTQEPTAKDSPTFDLDDGDVTIEDFKVSGKFKVLGPQFDRYTGGLKFKVKGVVQGGEHDGRSIQANYAMKIVKAERDFGK
ncbi:MAG: hypothetical protein HMLKMBBP_02894 [Planctomycetes bacterium]|nr:hypothetical protein [Planctomycetota bacterium]